MEEDAGIFTLKTFFRALGSWYMQQTAMPVEQNMLRYQCQTYSYVMKIKLLLTKSSFRMRKGSSSVLGAWT